MTRPQPKGWCPSTLQPMESGDGLIVRIKPPFSMLTSSQAQIISQLATRYGNGFIDFTSRANLQIRGVTTQHLLPLVTELQQAELASTETGRDKLNLILAPFTEPDTIGWHCAKLLYEAADTLPDLPAKFGFAIDCGAVRTLTTASADIRCESDDTGRLIIRCDGCQTGFYSSLAHFMDDIRAVLDWYLSQSDTQSRYPRMAQIVKDYEFPQIWQGQQANTAIEKLVIGPVSGKQIIAVPYGQSDAQALALLARTTTTIHVTSDNRLIVDDYPKDYHSFITSADDRRLNIRACPGLPSCQSGTIETRKIAQKVAEMPDLLANKTFHISGCTKGCAAPRPHDFCVTGAGSDYAIIENGCAWDSPSITSLSLDELLKYLKQG